MASELEPNNASTNASSLVADTYMEGALSSSSDLDIFKIPSTGLTTASYVTFDFDSPLSAPLTSAYKLTVLDSSGAATTASAQATQIYLFGDGMPLGGGRSDSYADMKIRNRVY